MFAPLIPHSPLQAEGSRERFQLISTAYEILKDKEERANYDYMLENPGRYRARGVVITHGYSYLLWVDNVLISIALFVVHSVAFINNLNEKRQFLCVG